MADVAAVPESVFAPPSGIRWALLWIPPRRAGKLPNEKFAKLQRRWRKRNLLYAAAFALLPAAVFAALSTLLRPPDPQFFLGFCVGAGCALFLSCMYLAVPDWIDKWRRGAEGERRTARKLRRLERQGWLAFHSTPTERGDRDHILLGPGGIFLLDSKVRRGLLSVNDEGGLAIDYGDDAPLIRPEALVGRATAAASRLAESVGEQTRYRPRVKAVIVLWGNFPERRAERNGVTFVHGDELVKWIESAPAVPLVRSFEADVVKAVARLAQTVDHGEPPSPTAAPIVRPLAG